MSTALSATTLSPPAPAPVARRRRAVRVLVAAVAALVTAALTVTTLVLSLAFLDRPGNSPDAFRGVPATGPRIVVAGASTVQGTISADWVSGLHEPGATVVNAGVNGHTTADLLARLDADVIDLDPDRVILLVGTNDIRGDVDPAVSRANVAAMLDRLSAGTDADLAVMSLQPLGEQLDSDLNDRVRAYNAALGAEAAARGVAYLPLFESLAPLIGPGAPDFSFPIVRTAFDRFLLGHTFADISRRHGLTVTADNVHLNERGAAVAQRLAADWIAQGR
jgi:acyl-CoA thioesterase I